MYRVPKIVILPFVTTFEKCSCGLRYVNDECPHCDSICYRTSFTSRKCKRCALAVVTQNIKHFIEDNYFVGFELETENQRQRIYIENEQKRLREFGDDDF